MNNSQYDFDWREIRFHRGQVLFHLRILVDFVLTQRKVLVKTRMQNHDFIFHQVYLIFKILSNCQNFHDCNLSILSQLVFRIEWTTSQLGIKTLQRRFITVKKRLSVIVIVLALMAIFASSVSAAGGKTVSLINVQYTKGGIALHFETSGLTKADLKDVSFYADSSNQNISCNFVDGGPTVRCVVAKGLAGKGAFRVTLAGFGFGGTLPFAKSSTLSCDAGEILIYEIAEYYEGTFEDTFWVTAEFWAFAVEMGWVEEDAANGWTYEIVDRFCAPEIEKS
jgi:hypothetical protein